MAKKRANGEGNIRKRKDGRWEGRYTAGHDPVTGKQIFKNVLGKTQNEVKEKLKKALVEAGQVDFTKSGQYTVGTWMDTWFENVAKIKVRPSSHQTYKGYIDNHIKPNIGKIPLEKLTNLTYEDSREETEAQIKQNIYYDILKQDLPVPQLDGIVSLMVDTICTTGKTVKISGESKAREEVCRRFLALNDIHIRYVFDRMKEENNIVQHPRRYLLARLYEAEEVMDTYYQIRVNHDLNIVNY